jgi:quercetin dioxygenase-like cupin family protein
MCPCEHWCYLARGRLRYRFTNGGTQEVATGDTFHIRAGHLAEPLEDTELIEFTRHKDYQRKAEHLAQQSSQGRGS